MRKFTCTLTLEIEDTEITNEELKLEIIEVIEIHTALGATVKNISVEEK